MITPVGSVAASPLRPVGLCRALTRRKCRGKRPCADERAPRALRATRLRGRSDSHPKWERHLSPRRKSPRRAPWKQPLPSGFRSPHRLCFERRRSWRRSLERPIRRRRSGISACRLHGRARSPAALAALDVERFAPEQHCRLGQRVVLPSPWRNGEQQARELRQPKARRRDDDTKLEHRDIRSQSFPAV